MLLTVIASVALTLLSAKIPGIHDWATSLVRQINFGTLVLDGMLPDCCCSPAHFFSISINCCAKKLAVGLLSRGWNGHLFLSGCAADGADERRTAAVDRVPDLWSVGSRPPITIDCARWMLRRVGIPKRIEAQLAGESLFNDGYWCGSEIHHHAGGGLRASADALRKSPAFSSLEPAAEFWLAARRRGWRRI